MASRPSSRARAFAPDPTATPGRACDSPGCAAEGAYRAPKSRSSLNDYHWFCLEHVRAYNASWDFYKGMSAGQIEAQTRADTGWQRPTWPLGSLGNQPFDEARLHDPLNLLATGRMTREAAKKQAKPAAPKQLLEPIRTLGLDWPVSLDALKARYKELAKRHHPDANGGNRKAEERLKSINLAYAAVRRHLTDAPPMAAAE